MTIDKRLPFGFLGEWGKVYKLHNADVFENTYEELEWVYNDGTAKIEIGEFRDSEVVRTLVDYQLDLFQPVNSTNALFCFIVPDTYLRMLSYRESVNRYGFSYGSVNTDLTEDGSYVTPNFYRHKIECISFRSGNTQRTDISYDETKLNGIVDQYTPNGLKVKGYIASSSASGGTQYLKGKMYELKVGTLNYWVSDFVPAREVKTGVVGFFDKIQRKFYTPVNNKTLTGGNATGTIYSRDITDIKYLKWQQSFYVDIGQDVQFKCAGNRTMQSTQPVKNLAAHSETKDIITSDATWKDGRYKSVVEVGDIVVYDGLYWVVDKIRQEEVYYPNEQAEWVISLKKIYEDILIGA